MRVLDARRTRALERAYSIDTLHGRLLEVALIRDGRAGERWRALRTHVDLDDLGAGRTRDVLPLVHRALADDGVDDPDLPSLAAVHRRAWYQNQMRFGRVGQVVGALTDAGVETMVLKGVALAQDVYRDAGLRPMADCDLLVRPGQVGRALEVLGDLAWLPDEPLPSSYVRRHRELDVFDPQRWAIDLHWHVSQWLIAPGDEWWGDEPFWTRSVPIEVAGSPTRALDRTDALLHALVHGARHGWRVAPQWIPDAVVIARAGPIDWERITSVSTTRGVALPVRHALVHLRDRFSVAVPGDVVARLDGSGSRRAQRVLVRSGQSHGPTATEKRWLGPFANTYRFWITETAPLDRRAAWRELPGWLADRHGARSAWGLPWTAARRAYRATSGRRSRAGVSTPPSPSRRPGSSARG